jgi:hypothetical protein
MHPKFQRSAKILSLTTGLFLWKERTIVGLTPSNSSFFSQKGQFSASNLYISQLYFTSKLPTEPCFHQTPRHCFVDWRMWLFQNFVLMNQNLLSNRSQNTTLSFVERRWFLLKMSFCGGKYLWLPGFQFLCHQGFQLKLFKQYYVTWWGHRKK